MVSCWEGNGFHVGVIRGVTMRIQKGSCPSSLAKRSGGTDWVPNFGIASGVPTVRIAILGDPSFWQLPHYFAPVPALGKEFDADPEGNSSPKAYSHPPETLRHVELRFVRSLYATLLMEQRRREMGMEAPGGLFKLSV